MQASSAPMKMATILLAGVVAPLSAQVPDTTEMHSVRDGIYSAVQAQRGRKVFDETCAHCHPPAQFAEAGYLETWAGETVLAFFEYLRVNMPDDNPGHLSRRAYADVLAYIFNLNGIPAGRLDLKSNAEMLKRIVIDGF